MSRIDFYNLHVNQSVDPNTRGIGCTILQPWAAKPNQKKKKKGIFFRPNG